MGDRITENMRKKEERRGSRGEGNSASDVYFPAKFTGENELVCYKIRDLDREEGGGRGMDVGGEGG